MKHLPRKRFGQHFLKDASVIAAIIDAISPKKTDLIVEIGPGLGAITHQLLTHLDLLHAIELDRDLAAHLKKNWPAEKLLIYQADALQFNFASITGETERKMRVVGNLPYNISTPLLFHLSDFISHIADQHFMLQKEVVQRMVAPPGSRTYGRLSVMLQWQYHMESLFDVPPFAFLPPPEVDSAVIRMIPRPCPLACDKAKLEKTVAQAFSQRRKILRNTLAPLFAENDLIDVGINPEQRPEDVSYEQFIALANRLP